MTYKDVEISSPFPMMPIKECIFSNRDFSIVGYGAIEGGKTINTKAIAKAIIACNKDGGGPVVIPAREWLTGPIHFNRCEIVLLDGF